MSSSASHSVSDIIDSHCQRQKQSSTSPHVSTMSTGQSHDRRVELLAVAHHPRPPTKPPGVVEANENDQNCLNLLHHISPQPWQHVNLRGTSADVHNQQLREPSKPARRNVPFVQRGSDVLRLAEPPDELRHADNGQWVKSVDSEYGWVCVQHAATLPHSTDSSVRQPLGELVSSCLPKSGQRELVTGRHLAVDSVSMLPPACHQAITATTARSRDLLYSTALESTGQFLRLC